MLTDNDAVKIIVGALVSLVTDYCLPITPDTRPICAEYPDVMLEDVVERLTNEVSALDTLPPIIDRLSDALLTAAETLRARHTH